ncbi:MAG: hypothetical protein CMI67_06390, partial [Pelagibaca sp.]|nr:hypothetical protein [Pelagibaca sp.]
MARGMAAMAAKRLVSALMAGRRELGLCGGRQINTAPKKKAPERAPGPSGLSGSALRSVSVLLVPVLALRQLLEGV